MVIYFTNILINKDDREKGTIAYWTLDFEGKPWNEDGTPKVPTYPNSMKQTFLSEFKNHENFILYQLEDTEYFNALVLAYLSIKTVKRKK